MLYRAETLRFGSSESKLDDTLIAPRQSPRCHFGMKASEPECTVLQQAISEFEQQDQDLTLPHMPLRVFHLSVHPSYQSILFYA